MDNNHALRAITMPPNVPMERQYCILYYFYQPSVPTGHEFSPPSHRDEWSVEENKRVLRSYGTLGEFGASYPPYFDFVG